MDGPAVCKGDQSTCCVPEASTNAGTEHSDCTVHGKTFSFVVPFSLQLFQFSEQVSKPTLPASPPSIIPISARTTSRLLVKLLLRMKMGLSVVFLCEMNTWSRIVQPTSKISAVLEPRSIGYKWMLKCFLQ